MLADLERMCYSECMEGAGGGPYVTASEVGAFVYCPESWYLGRRGQARAGPAVERLNAGAAAHRRIGHATDTLVAVDLARRGLLVAMLLVAVALLLLVLDVGVFRGLVPGFG